MDLGWEVRTSGAPGKPTGNPQDGRQPFHNKIMFCDMIGYSRQDVPLQADCQDVLNQVVGQVLDDLECDRNSDVIALPTGDGMLLNFLAPAPDIHLRAALGSLARWTDAGASKGLSVGLKIGLNTAMDFWGFDINGQRNVVGNGVNIAQRIMDLGAHGQVLMHDSVRGDLVNVREYAPKLVFRGDFSVKHGVNVPVAQYVDGTLPYVSDVLVEPPVRAPSGPLTTSDLLGKMKNQSVLRLTLGAEEAYNVRHIQDGVEDFLLAHGSLQRLRLRAHWLVGELLDNVFNHGGLEPHETVELRLDLARDGLVIETVQPERSGFEHAGILRGASMEQSFLHMMGVGGIAPRVYGESGRLVIGFSLPLDEGLSPSATNIRPAYGQPSQWGTAASEGRVIARPIGRVDETTWEAFSAHLLSAVEQAKADGAMLILDLADLAYMSSRGLRALTIAKREAGAEVPIILAAPNDRMREILAISRYDKLFKIVDNVDEA